MVPTLVIGLREGLEAALIVGIIAAFLREQGRRDLLRAVLAGVGAAVLLCLGLGLALQAYSRSLPQKQQEGLETVVGALAVVMVTYMVIWMRRHSRELKGSLEGQAAGALAAGAGSRAGAALVLMAFLAVIREGFETVVFLLAAFQKPGSGSAAGLGAVAGLAVAVGLGYGVYRGGVRLNLSKFFRATGLVLVVVASGLVVNCLHTAHEAGWLDAGQAGTFDLTWLVRPGSVQSSLLTGMLGLQPRPVLVELVGWLVYLVPVGLFVAWPPAARTSPRVQLRAALAAGVAIALAAGLLTLGITRRTEPDAAAAPVTGTTIAGRVVTVTVTAAHGCVPDTTSLRAGGVTVKIRNVDATAVTEVEVMDGERILGEKENLPPGFSGRFAMRLDAGTYTLYCPGATPERRALSVTGTTTVVADAGVAALLAQAGTGYADYVRTQTAALVTAAERLAATLRGTDLAAAQRAYIAARPYYERIEPVAESFVVGTDSIDVDLDARDGDVPPASWRGFHRIEKALFARQTLAGTRAYGTRLVADAQRLAALTATLTYAPTELANGAQELLDEVAASKITGEEERYSRIDMLDVADNVQGAQQAFSRLRPALQRIDPALATTITTGFDALDREIARLRTDANPSGYLLYGQLDAGVKRALAAAVKAVQEPLSRVASKVADA
ncbi:MAG TPA: iron uptake system protein EfeO [Jatrophihabitans sp.]|jgi:FTR1 family protein|uniref:iron uptake system protein EfeO n=1 Tax=Jatrophihabitans sp. TaxID=1932789 RepID=UPI002DFE4350|nr:iron uptake system protein EfeO [Jatrophihabitans sp.]